MRARSGERVLDLGCGPGIVSRALAPDAGLVVALDLTREMLLQARTRCDETGISNVGCVTGDGELLPFAAETFDAAVTRLALHHFPDPSRILHEIARVMKPGGRAIIADIISSEDKEEGDLHNALEALRDPSHGRMMPRTELLEGVRRAGLRVISCMDWQRNRRLAEWVRIVDAPEREAPLREVMSALARAGVRAGIELREEGECVSFVHRWVLVVAERP